jgi:enoyl-CoA hydratase/carnithine racemase
MELLLTSRRVDTTEPLRIGLVTRVEEDSLAAAIRMATTVAAMPRELATGIKQTVRRAVALDYVAVLEELEPRAQASLIARRVAGGAAHIGPLRPR